MSTANIIFLVAIGIAIIAGTFGKFFQVMKERIDEVLVLVYDQDRRIRALERQLGGDDPN